MIPSKADRKVTGTLTGDRVAMSFDESSLAHIMSVLTDLYSDPELAIVREYSTNALDAHVEAGQSQPIEVTTPTALSPYLKVKDYGVGLTVEDIHNIYSKYGASTKRSSNDAVGMLGLGCKSALTYASQFTLIAVKDGVRATVAVSRDEDGAGSMTIVDTSTTTEPNGVEVSIPARAGNALDRKARDFFAYWPEGTVLLNGAEPPRKNVSLPLTPDLSLIQTERYESHSYVVMGNVPYPAGEALAPQTLGLPYGFAVIARVPVGTVDFAPSREALQMTKRTKEALAAIAAAVKRELVAAVQRKIEDAQTKTEAIAAINDWSKLLGRNKPTSFRFKGQTVPTQISAPQTPPGKEPYRLLMTSAQNYRLSAAHNVRAVDVAYLPQSVWVTNYEPAKLTPNHKKKMLKWLKAQSFTTNNFLLVDFPLDTTWIAPERIVDWQTIKAIQLPRAQRSASGRLPGSYDLVVRTDKDTRPQSKWGREGKDIDQSKPVYYHHGNTTSAYYKDTILSALSESYTVICLPANRLDKFRRENPKIKSISEVVKEAFAKWQSKLTKDQKLALAIDDSGVSHDLQALKSFVRKIKDPEVVRAVKLAQMDVRALTDQQRTFMYAGCLLEHDEFKNPLDKYPLLDSYSFRSHNAHSIEYINLFYEHRLTNQTKSASL